MNLLRKIKRHPPTANRLHEWKYRTRDKERTKYPHLLSMKSLPAIGEKRGALLMALVNKPFWDTPSEQALNVHTNQWETLEIAQAWREQGFQVDVVNWRNLKYLPEHEYDVAIDARYNLGRWDQHLGARCIRISHLDFAHWLENDTRQLVRLEALKQRRGVVLSPRRQVGQNRAIEDADCATILGTKWSRSTYAFATKRLYSIPVSTQVEYDWIDRDWEYTRNRFVWVGSVGAVHKGLDLVLEAFAQAPHLHLTVVGPVDKEPDFFSLYRTELLDTDNIDFRGFMDVGSEEYLKLVRDHGFIVFPSCSECGASVVVGGLHAGLVPVVTAPARVDSQTDLEIADATPEGVLSAVLAASQLPVDELGERSRHGWEFACANHTRKHYAKRYREVIPMILEQGRHQ